MQPFRDKFQTRFQADFLGPLEKELAFSFTNLSPALHGRITLAFLPESGDKLARLLFIDLGTNAAALDGNLAAWRAHWTNAGKALKTTRIHNADFTTVVFAAEEVNRLLDRILPRIAPLAPAPTPSQPAATAEWTVGHAGGLFIVSDSPRAIQNLLTLRANNTVPSLANHAAFAPDASLSREAQVFAWLNLKTIFSRTTTPTPSETNTASLSTLLGAAGFADAHSLTAGLQQSADGLLLNFRVRVPEAARKGLFQILSLQPKDCAPPPFVPADTVKFTRLRLDLPQAWTNLEATLTSISPGAAGAIRFIIANAGRQKDLTFDLRERLLARLGDDLIICDKHPRGSIPNDAEPPPTLWLIGARNPEKAAAALKAIAELPPPNIAKYKQRDFLGRTIYSFNWPSTAEDGSILSLTPVIYAPNGSYVALSSDPALIEELLRGGDANIRLLRDKPGMAEATRRVGGLATGYFATANFAETARAFFATVRKDSLSAAALLGKSKLASHLGVGRDGGWLDWCDFSLLPPHQQVARYFLYDVSTLTANAEGYSYRLFAPAPVPAGQP